MKNILVSGASGIVGYGILRSLKKSEEAYNLIGTTIYGDSVAQGFSDIFELAPRTNDNGYIDWILEVIAKHNIDFLIPGIEDDVYKWVNHIPEMIRLGARILLNNAELINLCRDKWAFHEFLKGYNTPHLIESSLSNDFQELKNKLGLPFLLKPRRGFASKGILIVSDEESFLKVREQVGPILMAQMIVGEISEEFTTSAFCDGNGGFFNYMTLKRKLSKDGFTDRAEVVDVELIYDALVLLCEIFKPKGPTNFQFRSHEGDLRLLEINPRISSSTSIRTAFGYNESVMSVHYYLDNIIPNKPTIRKGKAIRYVEDQIMYL